MAPMRSTTGAAAMIVLVALAAPARAETTARIVETHPSFQATLGTNESFYVRIEYTTDEPVSLWARPYRNGEVVAAKSNASSRYSGSGEALGWFGLSEPGDVDEVRIRAGGGTPYREWDLAREPLQLQWTSQRPAAEALPDWVEQLQAVEAERQREEAQRRASEPVSSGTVALFSGFMLLVLALAVAGIVVPLWSVWKWRGGWRIAAAVPAAVIAFVVLRILIDTARDPTSHNLWPFEILMFGTLALVGIGVLVLIRKFTRAPG
jgi:hypothetical protein